MGAAMFRFGWPEFNGVVLSCFDLFSLDFFSPYIFKIVLVRSWFWLFPRVRGFRRMFDNSIPACAFFFFFKVKISLGTLIPLLRLGSVHSGSASLDHCGRVFPVTCVWAHFLVSSQTMPAQRHSQLTPTSLGEGCVRVQVKPATCIFGRMTGIFHVPLP